MEENGKKYFYHNDHLGGTNVVTDETGRQVEYIDYQPFGVTKTEDPTALRVRHKFTGKEMDESTGLYNFLARQYDPKLGRFISADPLEFSEEDIKTVTRRTLQEFLTNPQKLNRYSYCLNNPLKYLDPTGKDVVGMHGALNGEPGGLDPVFQTVRGLFPSLPSSNLDWANHSSFSVGRIRADVRFRPIFLGTAVAKVSSYANELNPRVYVGHSRGGDGILEAIHQGTIPADKNTRLIILGTNVDIIKGALNQIKNCGPVLIIAGDNDHFGGDRSYKSISNLENMPSNVRVISTGIKHSNMGSSREVQDIITENKNWLTSK
jgi:RHS repeat-associated protein